jgi:hypothetical protein
MRTRRLLVTDPTRRHWNETTAGRVLAAWRESAMSLGDFARANGVNAQRLKWWRKRIEAGTSEPGASVAPLKFIPAAVVGSARVALRLPGGVELEGNVAAIPIEWVAALARELGRA